MSSKDFLAVKQALTTVGWSDRYNKSDANAERTLLFDNVTLVSDPVMTNGQMFGTYSRSANMAYGNTSNLIVLTDEFSDSGQFVAGLKNTSGAEDTLFVKAKMVIGSHCPKPENVLIVE